MASAHPRTNDAKREAFSLIREGWDHLRCQSPLAAWGSWRNALRLDPESDAARQALAALESAGELPAAARARQRFQSPASDASRARWDARFRDLDATAPADAAEIFSQLARDDPDDAEAWYNLALCLGWIGRNSSAIAALDRFVALRADSDLDSTVSAWTLAEILRQGRGAEALADVLRYSVSISWTPDDSARLGRLAPELRRIPTPAVPAGDSIKSPALRFSEWLDRPLLANRGLEAEAANPPRPVSVLATVLELDRSLRLSSPDADALESVLERLARIVDLRDREVRREAAPLPLPFLDAAVWTFRLPDGLDPEDADRLTRERVESYYENEWIHCVRRGLDGRSPLEASERAARGDRIALAKLTAVIRLREQLGTRPSVGSLYQGYPFDRLRIRLGLDPADANSVDAADLGSASAAALDRLDPAALADPRLAAAFESAAGLRDDQRTEKFAAELAGRPPSARSGVDLISLAACLVRRRTSQDQPDQALSLIDRLKPEAAPEDRLRLTTWQAEILARQGRGADAAALYHDLLETHPNPAVLALDAAETLLDNGELEYAPAFLDRAVRTARDLGLKGVEARARTLLNQFPVDAPDESAGDQ